MSIKPINWDKNKLIPTIVQDSKTDEVLMLAYQNKEAFDLTLKTGYAHYFSRSKQRIWKKGETSGHTQKIVDMKLDCDEDTILLKVEQNGVACHTGRKSCFFQDILKNETLQNVEIESSKIYSVIDNLYHTILDRKKQNDPSKSYTSLLFNKGENSILKKVIEEAGEFCFAIKDDNEEEIIYECADLLYHSLVALAYKDINPDRIKSEIARRFGISGIEEKNSRIK